MGWIAPVSRCHPRAAKSYCRRSAFVERLHGAGGAVLHGAKANIYRARKGKPRGLDRGRPRSPRIEAHLFSFKEGRSSDGTAIRISRLTIERYNQRMGEIREIARRKRNRKTSFRSRDITDVIQTLVGFNGWSAERCSNFFISRPNTTPSSIVQSQSITKHFESRVIVGLYARDAFPFASASGGSTKQLLPPNSSDQ